MQSYNNITVLTSVCAIWQQKSFPPDITERERTDIKQRRLLLLAVELAEELGDGGLELGIDAAHYGLG